MTRSRLLRVAFLLIIAAIFAHSVAPARAQTPAASQPNFQAPRIVPNQSHPQGVSAMSLSKDGGLLATVSGDETAKLWDVASGRLLRAIYAGLEQRLVKVALSPDGKTIIAGTESGTTFEWDSEIGIEISSEPKPEGRLHWLLYSSDGSLFVVGEHEKRDDATTFIVSSYNSTTGVAHKHRQTVSLGFLPTAQFLPDGRNVVMSVLGGSSGFDRDLLIWDAQAGTMTKSAKAKGEHVAVSSTGVIAVSNQTSIDLFTASGVNLRSTEPIKEYVGHLFFSHDGKTIHGLDTKDNLVGWDVDTGKRTSTIKAPAGAPPLRGAPVPLPDGRQIVAAFGSAIHVRDLKTGAVVRSIGQSVDRIFALTPLPDPRQVLVGGVTTLAGWDVTAGRHVRKLETADGGLHAVHATADGKTMLLGYQRRLMRLIDGATGREIARITDTQKPLTKQQQEDAIGRSVWAMTNDVMSRSFAFALSADGRRVAHGRNDGLIRIFETSGTEPGVPKLIATLEEAHGRMGPGSNAAVITALAFSPDGKLLVSGATDQKARLWDAATAKPVRELVGHGWSVMSLAFTPDGKHLITGSGDRSIKQWRLDTGELVRTLGLSQGVTAHDGVVKALAVSADSKLLVSAGSEGVVRTWDLTTGKARHQLDGHVGEVTVVGVSTDGKRVFSGGDDATFRVWDSASGKPLATFIAAADGEWLAMTADGFFSASRDGANLLTIVRGHDVTTVDQVHQSLYNPDLVREALTGDVNSEVKEAAQVINLSKVLDSGPAPDVVLKSPPQRGGTVDSVNITATAEITDRNKGIGRIEWRVNGVTAAVSHARSSGRSITVSQPLALDAGDNRIEVVAYNASNLLASTPARATVTVTAKTHVAKPRLHVLAIGIDAYTDRSFGPLKLAINDANALAEALRQGKGQLYSDIRVKVLTDLQASRDNLEQAVARFAEGIDRRDTFIFFAAAHGYAHKNKFYLIPADYKGGIDPAALEAGAISQDRLQDWLANRIRAHKALVLLDTCESGALVAGHMQSRTDAAAAEATVGRLHEATGRPVLAAAAQGQFAHEGVGSVAGGTHGIFTWALLDALRKGDRNGNGTIELSEIVTHVQDEVPKLAAKLGGLARSATLAQPVYGAQNARFGTRGEDFPLIGRLP